MTVGKEHDADLVRDAPDKARPGPARFVADVLNTSRRMELTSMFSTASMSVTKSSRVEGEYGFCRTVRRAVNPYPAGWKRRCPNGRGATSAMLLRFIHSDDDWAPTPGYAASLMDAHRDPVAGVIQFLLDSYPKWNDWTAKWLAEHVAPAPFIMRPVPGGGVAGLEYELVSASDAGLTFDLEVERFNNHRIWSNAYPDSRAVPAFENLRAVLTT